jgi:hypothetical protein
MPRCGNDLYISLSRLPGTGRPRFLWTAFILLPTALVCDVLDGYVARLDKKRQSVLGADLDSLADVISFGVAPRSGIHARSARRLGHADPHVFRGVRRQPSRAVQRDGIGARR